METYEKLGAKDRAIESCRKASTAIADNPGAAHAVPLVKKKLASLGFFGSQNGDPFLELSRKLSVLKNWTLFVASVSFRIGDPSEIRSKDAV